MRPSPANPKTGLAALFAILCVLCAGAALADDNFDVSVANGGRITVTAKGDWHVNADYPWVLSVGGSTFDKTKFTFAEKTAVVTGAPSGTGTLRGGVCGDGKCRSFKQAVTIP